MRLIWEPAARADRKEIYAYIRRDNPRAAIKLDKLFVEKATYLLQYPQMGRPGRLPGTREQVVRSNYILVYKLTQDTVCIRRVLHTARHWP